MSWRHHHNKSRANERTAEVAALRLPFGLPSGREHFVVARTMSSAAEIVQSRGTLRLRGESAVGRLLLRYNLIGRG